MPRVIRETATWAMVLGVGILLGGCSSSANEPDDNTTAVTSEAPGARATGSPVPEVEFDYQEYLAVLQRASNVADPPTTDLVRVIAPRDQSQVWLDCMQEAGWDVSITADGGMSPPPNLPEDQWPAFDVSDYVCHAQYPVDQSLVDAYGIEQVDLLYGYYVEDLAQCLEERDHEVPDPPSLETFRASWKADGTGALHASETTWYPYLGVDAAGLSVDEWEQLNESCPQSPPRDVLYPSGR
ncbi:hypothetical protein NF557_03745 [Ornithinimicrobium cryptoxanthini]|uniref:Uncharacterized protein n=1 Tax=Ornithinimicrobium cryptoxanthini TaxID=2934161 RepID=A0ABY4YK90_9MICO|nr:hypothetical protein [Ornithinimicrobium cryptoxanthini]USQ77042.1 hypothetical protein NF557_03745 [Ornithinimicrobium cryptoxanthini]